VKHFLALANGISDDAVSLCGLRTCLFDVSRVTDGSMRIAAVSSLGYDTNGNQRSARPVSDTSAIEKALNINQDMEMYLLIRGNPFNVWNLCCDHTSSATAGQLWCIEAHVGFLIPGFFDTSQMAVDGNCTLNADQWPKSVNASTAAHSHEYNSLNSLQGSNKPT